MKFQTTATIHGARQFNDSVEGNRYDFTKVRLQMPVPDASDNEVGFKEVELQWGTHDNFEKLKNLSFPFEAVVDLVATSKGYDFHGFKATNTPAAKV